MQTPSLLQTTDGRRIAYHRTEAVGEGATQPGVVFLGGFRSDMTGSKAVWIEDWCRARGRAFLRFDYTGHGGSSGDFLDGTIGGWTRDAEDAVAALTKGPQILVGSSMGGWIALLLARRAPERIAGLIGIAAAPDFTEDSMWASFPGPMRERLLADGRVELPSDYADEPYVITRALIEDGRAHLLLRQPLPLPFPLRLLHGTADADVAMRVALRLLEHVDCPDARLLLVKGAGHRFSEPRELRIIGKTLHGLTPDALRGAGD